MRKPRNLNTPKSSIHQHKPSPIIHRILFLLIAVGTQACSVIADSPASSRNSNTPNIPYCITGSQTVNEPLFTQGLLLHNNLLYTSGGGYGKSKLRWENLQTKEKHQIDLPNHWFAEGIALTPQGLWLLTWKQGIASLRHPKTLQEIKRANYKGQGWGLTYTGTQLVMSNGSDKLYFRNPETFKLEKVLKVTENGKATKQLNELEFIDGSIYANIWRSDKILKISTKTGKVEGTINLEEISKRHKEQGVLNGIAWSKKIKEIVITGKNWKNRYKLKRKPEILCTQ